MTYAARGGEGSPFSRGSTLSRTFGPERLAAILSVLVVAVVAGVVIGGTGGPATTPTTMPTSAPSAAASPAPSDSLASGPPASATWASTASALLEADRRLIDLRETLAAATVAEAPTSELARDLRAMNTLLVAALDVIDSLEAGGASADLVDDLRATHRDALDASLATLQASLQNAAAYQAGATEVVAILADLESLDDRLATAAGLPPP